MSFILWKCNANVEETQKSRVALPGILIPDLWTALPIEPRFPGFSVWSDTFKTSQKITMCGANFRVQPTIIFFFCLFSRCGCGRSVDKHFSQPPPSPGETTNEFWHVGKHSEATATDAYGTIEFQGGAHPTKAQVCSDLSFLFHSYSRTLIF
jgi:hypothetical protein